MAESYINAFLSSDTKQKLVAAEAFSGRLDKKSFIANMQSDVRIKLTNACVSILKDANPKIVLVGFDCLQKILSTADEWFVPLINLTFDTIVQKFQDAKITIRVKATEAMTTLLGLMGVAPGFERLSLHMTHRNYRVREHVLYTVMRLQEVYREEVTVIPNLCPRVALLLSDTIGSVRQLAVEAIAKLYLVFGDSLMADLETLDLKSTHLKMVTDAIASQNINTSSGGVLNNGEHEGLYSSLAEDDPSRCTAKNDASSVSSRSVLSGMTGSGVSSRLHPQRSMSSRRASLGPGLGVTSAIPGDDQKTGYVGTSGLSATGRTSSLKAQSSRTLDAETFDANPTMTGSAFHPKNFMNLLEEGPQIHPIRVYGEKELSNVFESIEASLADSNWNERLIGLGKLQGLAHGDGLDFDTFTGLLRRCQDLIATQLTDLRSTLVKEACRTVGVLACRMESAFNAFVDVWFNRMIKLTAVKTNVISSAGDRALRILLATARSACSPRLFALVSENCVCKSPTLRHSAYEYACLIAALWEPGFLEKNLVSLKSMIRSGVADADPSARRAARQLFWVLRKRTPTLQSNMERFIPNLEPIAQKHLASEIQAPTAALEELLDVMNQCSKDINAFDKLATEIAGPARSVPVSSSKSGVADERTSGDMSPKSSGRTSSSSRSQTSSPENASKVPTSITMKTRSGSRAPSERPPPIPAEIGLSESGSQEIQDSSLDNSQRFIKIDESAHLPAPQKFSRRISTTGPIRVAQPGVGAKKVQETRPIGSGSRHDTHEAGNAHAGIDVGMGIDDVKASYSDRFSAAKDSTFAGGASRVMTAPGQSVGPSSIGSSAKQASRIIEGPKRVAMPQAQPKTHEAGDTRSALLGKSGPTRVAVGSAQSKVVEEKEERRSHYEASSRRPVVQSTRDKGSEHESESDVPAEMIVFSLDALRTMLRDSLWSNKLKALEAMTGRLNRGIDAQKISKNADCGLTSSTIEAFVDLSNEHLGDAHHKVTAEAFVVLSVCVNSFSSMCIPKIGVFIPTLFQRLADRRAAVRDAANELLNSTRTAFDSVALITALSPKLPDIPERMKAAMMQYLGAIAPHCGAYFTCPQSAWAFLGRMASILGASGSKPSTSLLIAGRRLLELVYQTAPSVVCSQIAMLPLQQQTLLKQLLEQRVPDIESLVSTAAKSDWNSRQHIEKENSRPRETPAAVQRTQHGYGEAVEDRGRKSPVPALEKNVFPVSAREPAKSANVVSTGSRGSSAADSKGRHATQSSSEALEGSKLSERESETKFLSVTKTATSGTRDVAWLLNSLQINKVGLTGLIDGMQELKELIKTGDEKYWRDNCVQIVSVLLETLEHAVKDSQSNDGAHVGLHSDVAADAFSSVAQTGLSPQIENGPLSSKQRHLHLACKALLLIVRQRGAHVKKCMELVITRLCPLPTHTPAAVTLHIEHILTDLGRQDPMRFVRVMLPYMSPYDAQDERSKAPFDTIQHGTPSARGGTLVALGACPHVRLLALHVMAATLKLISSTDLLQYLPTIVAFAMPSLTSALVDLRQAVVFLFVEVYLIVGDALFPYLTDLTPPQRKLLTIYIDRKMQQLNQNTCDAK